MTIPTDAPRFTPTAHLCGLFAEVERLAAAVGAGQAAGGEPLRADAALATLKLDGSPIESVPAADVLAAAAEADGSAATAAGTGTWLDAFGAGEVDDPTVVAAEYLGARAGLDADDLAGALLSAPLQALAALHRRMTRGLLAPERAGTPRRTPQAVHDRSVGRVIYRPPDPDEISARLAALGEWVVAAADGTHPVVLSGVVHHRLLALHPYEAANGRLARTAARLVLRRGGLDPHRLAVAEVVLLADPIGYYQDVPATLRRRDLAVWLERWGEAVAGGLRLAARHLGVLDPDLPGRAQGFVASWREPRFTLADYRAAAGVGTEEVRADLVGLLDAGRVRRVLGSRGLRYEVV